MNKLALNPTICFHLKRGVLAALLGLFGIASMAATQADQVFKPSSYTPKNGDSLDHVIAQTMADSPLKIDVLRQAFLKLNPNAFEPAKGKSTSMRLRKGASLTVPDSEQLRQLTLLPKVETTPTDQSANSALDKAIERKRWVHFP